MKKNKADTAETITIGEINRQESTFMIIGQSPLIMERMSEKVKFGLLIPKPKKTRTEKESSLKHNPLEEYRDSAYTSPNDSNPTRLQLLSTAFKASMMNAAIDIPGAKKAAIGRLTFVAGTHVDVYGLPKMIMSVVRSADMNKTPDIRTRCIVPEWAALINVSFVTPQLKGQDIVNLLGAAGEIIGVGGWRPQKGSGSFGRFKLVMDKKDKELNRILKIDRKQQDAALAQPDFYDQDTQDLYRAYLSEAQRRGFKVVA